MKSMSIQTHRAQPSDAKAMCDLLNPIIEEGSTTAHRNLFDSERMIRTHIEAPLLIRTTLASEGAELLGFQLLEWADPEYEGPEAIPETWAVIASFVQSGRQGLGIGRLLWRETLLAAKSAGVEVIDASIRSDNVPGLAYYSGLGFRDYSTIKAMKMSDGSLIDKTRKRYDIA